MLSFITAVVMLNLTHVIKGLTHERVYSIYRYSETLLLCV